MPFFQVIVPPLDQPLLYEVSCDLWPDPLVGQRVLVPLRKKWVTGYLWEKVQEPESGLKIKTVSQIPDPVPFFSEALRPFFTWIAHYYLSPLGQVLKTALPAGLSVSSYEQLEITPLGIQALEDGHFREEEQTLLQALAAKGRSMSEFDPEEKKTLKQLEDLGWVEQTTRMKKETARPKKERWVYPGAEFKESRFSEKDQPIFQCLSSDPCLPVKEFCRRLSLSAHRLATFSRKGLIEIRDRIGFRDPFGEILDKEGGPFVLTGEQEKALTRINEAVKSTGYHSILLHGITGSGKTEVYLKAAAETIEQGRQVLILVPEIGLVHQMEGRFRLRFGDRIALLHSHLSPGQRLDQWRGLQSGRASIVIGTRSAIFAPLSCLGLIVVDEEHDPSYKQMDSLRYNARDLALVRGRLAGATVVLGSATPAVSTLYLRRQKKISYLRLSKRVREQTLPEIQFIDLKKLPRGRQVPLLAPPLEEAIKQNLKEGHQTLLFLNRRGFDTLILCTQCATVLKCRNCALTLTFHAKENRLMCHTCGYHSPLPERCPECQQAGIKSLGMGTEKVEQALALLFPQAIIDRMDRDTVTRKKAHFEILKKVRDRKTDILIGTQMITKGHDFPQVTLIGVLCADHSLNWPDFRAGERTFQLLAQVAGRAGRGSHPGQVYIQTFNPEHYLFNYVRHHDYLGFYHQEIQFRRALLYPPFSRLINVLFQGNKEESVKTVANRTSDLLKKKIEEKQWGSVLEVLGPVPAPITRIKGRFRWQMLLKGGNYRLLHEAARVIQQADKTLVKGMGVQIIVDVDPVDML
jgi:primosomal protein N' (replication factor Y)